MRKLVVLTIAAVSVIGGGDTVVIGQTSQTPQPSASELRRSGWVLTPALTMGGEWDSNVLLVHPGDDPPADYATPIGPSLSLDFLGRRTAFSSGYEGSFFLYRTASELNSSEQRLRLLVRHRATRRLTVFASENFDRAPTTEALQLAGVPFYRIGSRTNTIGGGVEAALSKYTTFTGEYRLRHVDFEFDERLGRELQGGHAHELVASLVRALSPRLKVGGQYELQRAIVTQGLDRFNIHTGSATAEFDLTQTLKLSGLVGIAALGEGLTHDAQIGPAIQAGISQRFQFATVSAAYQRSFIPSFGFGGTYENEEWTGNVHVPFAGERGYVDGGLSWLINQPLEVRQPSLRSLWLSTSVGYHATRWLKLEGYYSRAQQDTQRAGGQLGRNQTGFRVVATRPLKLR